MSDINCKCPTNLLLDDPASEDGFSDGSLGSHTRLANAIAELIKCEKISRPSAIGLEGRWGAGKSTVVRLLEAQLETEDESVLIKFDAWAHEGDPLRRTFIETTVKELESRGWLSSDDIKELKLDRLSKKRVSTQTKSSASITWLGKFFGLAILMLPVGARFLAEPLKYPPGIDFKEPIWYQSVVGFTLTFSFVLVLLINGIISYLDSKNLKEAFKSENWRFLAGETQSEVVSDATSNPDPTSLEFSEIFREVISLALKDRPSKKIVLVIDNLDRINHEDALSIWSTLQTFVADSNHRDYPWADRLWFLVPYDPIALGKIWDKESSGSSDSQDQMDSGDVIANGISQSFFDKSFVVRFEVSPLVLSNWKSYLVSQFTVAMPLHGSDAEGIFKMYSRFCLDRKLHPTPREIKAFINQIGIIHRQWLDVFPIDHVAYYVLLKKTHRDVAHVILKGDLPHGDLVRMASAGLLENLSGLFFNVEKKLGQQILLTDPIFDSLRNGSFEGAKELIDIHGDGFWVIGQRFCGDYIRSFAFHEMASVFRVLNNGHVKIYSHREEYRDLYNVAKEVIIDFKNWDQFNEEIAGDISAFIGGEGDKDAVSKVIGNVVSLIKNLNAGESGIDFESIDGLVILKRNLDICHPNWLIGDEIAITDNVNSWMGLADILVESKYNDVVLIIRPDFDSQLIADAVADFIRGGNIKLMVNCFRVSFGMDLGCDWGRILLSINERLQYTNNVDPSELVSLMEIGGILEINQIQGASQAMSSLVYESKLAHAFAHPDAETDLSLSACIMGAYLRHNPSFSATQNVGNSARGSQRLRALCDGGDLNLARELVEELRRWGHSDLICKMSEFVGFTQFVFSCIRFDLDLYPGSVTMPSEYVIDNYKFLKDGIDDVDNERVRGVLKYLGEHENFIQFLMDKDKVPKENNFDIYLDVISVFPDNVEFNEWCVEGLIKTSRQRWADAVRNSDELLKFLIATVNRKIAFSKFPEFQNAIGDLAVSMIHGEFGAAIPSCGIQDIMDSFSGEKGKGIVRKQVIKAAFGANGTFPEVYVSFFGSWISDEGDLLSQDNLISALFEPIALKGDSLSMDWLAKVAHKFPNLLKKFKGQPVDDFLGRLGGEYSNAAASSSAKLILDKWGEENDDKAN